MKVEEFKEMPLDEKINCLWDKGLAIHQDNIDEGFTFCIFEIDGFYVEAIFSRTEVINVNIMEDVIQFNSYVDRFLRTILNNS